MLAVALREGRCLARLRWGREGSGGKWREAQTLARSVEQTHDLGVDLYPGESQEQSCAQPEAATGESILEQVLDVSENLESDPLLARKQMRAKQSLVRKDPTRRKKADLGAAHLHLSKQRDSPRPVTLPPPSPQAALHPRQRAPLSPAVKPPKPLTAPAKAPSPPAPAQAARARSPATRQKLPRDSAAMRQAAQLGLAPGWCWETQGCCRNSSASEGSSGAEAVRAHHRPSVADCLKSARW